jgi:hypothetical protein
VLEGLARASGGRFSPEEIDEAFTDGAWILSFRHHGKRYEVSLPYSDDMFRSEAIDLVNQALVDGGIANRFEPLPAFDQIIYLTFVSEGTRQAAVDRGLIPNVPHLFGDEFGDD